MQDFSKILELREMAPRIIWFETTDLALADPIRFVAYAMQYATHEDMAVIRKYMTDKEFIVALDKTPAGIVDGRSWAYWNAVLNRYPAPEPPIRKIS